MTQSTSPAAICVRWLTLALPLVFLSGCGGGPSYPHATICGDVTLDGEPIENGTITFFPLAQSYAGSGGYATISNGKYQLSKVPLGEITFTFSALVETGKMVEILGKQVPERVNPISVRHQEEGISREIDKSGVQDFSL